MTKNPARRLGCTGNENQIRSHPFFKDLDWAALELRRVEPPFRPKVVRSFLFTFFLIGSFGSHSIVLSLTSSAKYRNLFF